MNKNKLGTTIYDHVATNIDHATGEITQESSKQIVKRDKTPEFVMLYAEGVGALSGASLTPTETKVLFNLLEGYVLPSNMLILNGDVRDLISEKIGNTKGTVDKAVQKLKKKGIIIKNGVSFFLNPFIFGKGNWNEIKKLRYETITEYDFTNNQATTQKKTSALYDNKANKDNLEIVDAQQNISNDGRFIDQKVIVEDKDENSVDNETGNLFEINQVNDSPSIVTVESEDRKKLKNLLGESAVANMDDNAVAEALLNLKKNLF